MKKSLLNGRAIAITLFTTILMMNVVRINAQTQDGTQEHPFQISTAEQLKSLAARVNTGSDFYFEPSDGKYYASNATGRVRIYASSSNVYYELTADISLNDANVSGCDGDSTGLNKWDPIGNSTSMSFHGHFDGRYHIISGLYFKNTSNTSTCAGLFGTVSNGSSVKNIGLVNSYIEGYTYVGGIVGYLVSSSVTHCFVDATIASASRHVGGIVGRADGDGSYIAVIDTCYAAGSITSASDHIGGVCGTGKVAKITSCYSSAIEQISLAEFSGKWANVFL